MRKSYLVARREYVENLRTKTFWIGVSFFPVMLLLMFLVPSWLEERKDARRYAVIDRSGWLAKAIEERAARSDLEKIIRFALDQVGKKEELRKLVPEAALEEIEKIEDVDEFIREPGDSIAKLLNQSLPRWWLSLAPDEARRHIPGLMRALYVQVEIDPSLEDPEAELNRRLNSGELFGYFVIAGDPIESDEGCKYVSNNLTDDNLRDWYSDLATEIVRSKRIEKKGIDEQTAEWLSGRFRFESRKVTATGVEEEVKKEDKIGQFGPIAFVYLLWVAIFTTAQMLLTNTIEEKSSRIIEVLLSSVSSFELMAGKIAGIAATGLTVLGSWVIWFVAIIKSLPYFLDDMPDVDFTVFLRDPAYISSFLVYFLLGYLLYSSAFAAMGSVCNTLKESQNLIMPVMIVLIVPLFAMVPIGQDPNGALARVLSYVPPFTPFVMMNRAAGPPSALEYVLTTALLVASIAVSIWGAGKIFRVGILMTGKPPRPMEIVRILFR